SFSCAADINQVEEADRSFRIYSETLSRFSCAADRDHYRVRDLNPTSSAGDLEVTIKESDNSETVYTGPLCRCPHPANEKVIKIFYYGWPISKQ
ncbi:hypothetical protein ACTMQE_06060, partial [Escherichia coli]